MGDWGGFGLVFWALVGLVQFAIGTMLLFLFLYFGLCVAGRDLDAEEMVGIIAFGLVGFVVVAELGQYFLLW